MKKIGLIISLLFAFNVGTTQIFEDHQWEDRLIVIFTPSPADMELKRQLLRLDENGSGLDERDLKIYQVFLSDGIQPDGADLDRGQAMALRKQYGVAPDTSFVFILIGKDGTVKLRSEEVVTTERLFALIDSMPMRKAEMRRQRDQ